MVRISISTLPGSAECLVTALKELLDLVPGSKNECFVSLKRVLIFPLVIAW